MKKPFVEKGFYFFRYAGFERKSVRNLMLGALGSGGCTGRTVSARKVFSTDLVSCPEMSTDINNKAVYMSEVKVIN